MELLIVALVVVMVMALLIFKNSAGKGLEVLDVNKNGKVDVEDAKAVVKKTKAAVKTAANKVSTGTRGRKSKKVT